MEANEKKRQADFEKLKNSMREKKKTKMMAHKKVTARTLAKSYMARLKENSYGHLKQVGFYTDQFKEQVLEENVVPWLQARVFEFIQDLEIQESIPTRMAIDHFNSEQMTHLDNVAAERERQRQGREEIERQKAKKEEEKRLKKEAREKKRKEEELEALRKEIEANFVEKGESKAENLTQELIEIDGQGDKDKHHIGVIGGILGQVIITLAILEKKYNRKLSSMSRASKKSSKSKDKKKKGVEDDAKSHKSGKSGKSGVSGISEGQGTPKKDPTLDENTIDYSLDPNV